MKEIETMVKTVHFGEVPESALPKLNKEREERMKLERERAYEQLKNTPPFVLCPLAALNDFDTKCRREACALFVGNKCALANIAHGEASNTTGKRCPLSGRKCVKECILNGNGGCIITALGKE